MIPIDQTKLHTDNQKGNCLMACFASLLEIPIEDVPEFDGESWFSQMTKWLETIGFDLIRWSGEVELPGYYMVMGTSPRGDFNHQVIYKNGVLIHDPHPSKAGGIEVKEIWALLPLDPAYFLIKGA